jgi:molybdate transport system substrate-binding protein
VPVGGYSLAFLDKASQDSSFTADFRENVLSNVVSYEDSVRGVLTKVSLGEADAGIVYHSDWLEMGPERMGQLQIPEAVNIAADYPIAVLAGSRNPELAQAFVDFTQSDAGQAILEQYGFTRFD